MTQPWSELRKTFLPPKGGLFHFGGEMFVKYESGDVHYQDEFGRTEKPREFLIKKPPDKPLRPGDTADAGGENRSRSVASRSPRRCAHPGMRSSIRERNIHAAKWDREGLGARVGKKDWVQIRRELTDEQIKEVYFLYEALWPLETDLLALLPKPDGDSARGLHRVYSPSVDH